MLQRTLYSVLLCIQLLLTVAHADTSTAIIPPVRDLSKDALFADKQRLPILIMFSAEYCEFCRVVENQFLKPMIYSGHYKDKVMFRIVKIDDASQITDFQGQQTYVDAFAKRHKVWLTPTLKLYDASGKQLVPDIIGVNTVELYGGYIDDAINKSLQMIRSRDPYKNLDELARK